MEVWPSGLRHLTANEEVPKGAHRFESYRFRMTPAQQKLYDKLIADPDILLKIYADYIDLLTLADTAGWYAEQFAMADAERNKLKAELEELKKALGQ